MAKRNRTRKTPQARHGKKSPPSRHDKRGRLGNCNPERRRTEAARVPLTGALMMWIQGMSRLLDPRNGFRLSIVLAGAMLASGRRTASSWFRAAGVGDDWDRFYDLLIAIGKQAPALGISLLHWMVRRFDPGPDGHWTFAVDDTPTQRYGRDVEGANIHHDPTPGPAGGSWLYGHNWVCVALLMTHPLWGVLALPVLSMLYVRKCDVPLLDAKYGWKFRTKHELALELIQRVMGYLRAAGSRAGFVVVMDGAYAIGPLLRPLLADGATVISRLRRNSQLFDLPVHPRGGRGRPRIYGQNRISLAKRAGRHDGWQSITFLCRGANVTRRYKTFLATTRLTGGAIRVVLLEHESGAWAAYFSTNPQMDVQTLLETGAARWAIEEHFRDVKEVWGAGQQQVRNVWSSIGCWHLNTWLYTMVELASWDLPAEELVDRSDRSWDNPHRRPSHADRRRRIIREMLRKQFLTDLPDGLERSEYQTRIVQLLNLAA
jgi:hypothetical protein